MDIKNPSKSRVIGLAYAITGGKNIRADRRKPSSRRAARAPKSIDYSPDKNQQEGANITFISEEYGGNRGELKKIGEQLHSEGLIEYYTAPRTDKQFIVKADFIVGQVVGSLKKGTDLIPIEKRILEDFLMSREYRDYFFMANYSALKDNAFRFTSDFLKTLGNTIAYLENMRGLLNPIAGQAELVATKLKKYTGRGQIPPDLQRLFDFTKGPKTYNHFKDYEARKLQNKRGGSPLLKVISNSFPPESSIGGLDYGEVGVKNLLPIYLALPRDLILKLEKLPYDIQTRDTLNSARLQRSAVDNAIKELSQKKKSRYIGK